MKLKQLRLIGFKSFVESTDLIIEPGLTGVVGPNGCGKSNLLEALRWVMGETSFKAMRGSAMEDVIFAGTDKRPARNHAEVTLFIDNAERTAPAAYNDHDVIEISRRIERNAGSTFRVNGKEVRARDAQLFFADASTGAHSPALVRQGQIGELIASKPINRRRILEEAAGITGLYTRRHEAELRLRAAETNLTRLDDVMAQMEQQLASLKRQARQASRYRNLSGHIREAEAIQLHLKWQQASAALEREERELRETDANVLQFSREVALATNAQTKAAELLPPLRQAEAEAAARLHRLNVEQEQLKAERDRAVAEQERLKGVLADIEGDKQREAALVADAEAALGRLASEEEALKEAQAGVDELKQAAEADLAEIREALSAREGELDTLQQEIAKLNAERESLLKARQAAEQRVERLKRRKSELEAELEKARGGEDPSGKIAGAEAQLAMAEQRLADLEAAVQAKDEEKALADEAKAAAQEPLQAAERRLGDLRAEAKALTDLLAGAGDQQWVPLLDALKADPGYETALGAALGDDLDVPADERAPLRWVSLPPFDEAQPLPDGAVPLSKHVKGPKFFERRLSQIGVIEADAGEALQTQLKPGQRLVSRDGDLWRWDGLTADAEAPTAAAKRLEQRNRLADLESALADAEARAEDAQKTFAAQAQKAEWAASAAQGARNDLREAQKLAGAARDTLQKVERETAQQLQRLAALDANLEQTAGELSEAEGVFAEQAGTLEALKSDTDLQSRAAGLREQVGTLRRDLSQASAQRDSILREAEARERRLKSIGEERSAWTRRVETADAQAERLALREEEAKAQLEKLAEAPSEIEARQQTLLSHISEADAARKEAADRLAEAEAALSEVNEQLKAGEAAVAEQREARARLSGLVDGAKERLAEVAARIEERLQVAPERALASVGVDPEKGLPALDQIEAKLDRLRRERENLGGVNLRADEEAAELAQTLEETTAEREDLVQAISKLRQGIQSLNREGRERILEAFEKVNENFSRLFQHLFTGGEAHLKLTDSDDPLEAGLEIMARPPGKRLQVMSLLSGGEQALTAMALIFAVFLTNPSPICVLDEVDAPLDDANVERFCQLMEEMVRTTDTRFLIITHHALTMARMNRLFGVTMQERGVSTLVSVDLDQAEQFREAS